MQITETSYNTRPHTCLLRAHSKDPIESAWWREAVYSVKCEARVLWRSEFESWAPRLLGLDHWFLLELGWQTLLNRHCRCCHCKRQKTWKVSGAQQTLLEDTELLRYCALWKLCFGVHADEPMYRPTARK